MSDQRPLSIRETMACLDDNGRFRCPCCGRFARPDSMTRDNLLSAPCGTVSLLPRCGKCADSEADPPQPEWDVDLAEVIVEVSDGE